MVTATLGPVGMSDCHAESGRITTSPEVKRPEFPPALWVRIGGRRLMRRQMGFRPARLPGTRRCCGSWTRGAA